MGDTINRRGIYVGIFIAIGIAFLVGGILTIGNLHSTFQKKISVSTIFGDVNGLQSGNNIWFSGVKIGTVKKIEFYGKSQVKVILNINTESQKYIRRDAKVKISTDGLIGNKILVIYGGSDTARMVEEGDVLANELMLSTEDMMNTFQQNNLNVLKLTKKISDGEGSIGKLINNDDLYNKLAATANSLQKASANAQVLTASLSQFSAQLNRKGTLANDLVTDSVTFVRLKNSVFALQRTMDSVNVFVNDLKQAGSNPNSPVGVLLRDEKAGTELKNTISNLEKGSEKLDKNLEALQHSFLMRRYFKKQAKKAEKEKN
ncbi:MAG TPA: MlaD family protein [Flavobacteriales bacterium]|nr:MlaD family protein [Flavobacteriales bacterium]